MTDVDSVDVDSIEVFIGGRTIEVPRELAKQAYARDVPAHLQHAYGPRDVDLRAAVVRRFGESIRSQLSAAKRELLRWSTEDTLTPFGRGVVRTVEPEASESVNQVDNDIRHVSAGLHGDSQRRQDAAKDRHDEVIRPRLRADVKGSVVLWLADTPLSRASAGAIQRVFTVKTFVVSGGNSCQTSVARGDSVTGETTLRRKSKRGSKGGRKHRKSLPK